MDKQPVYGWINARLRIDKLRSQSKSYEGVWGGGEKWWYDDEHDNMKKITFMVKHDDEKTEMMDD